MDFSVDHQIDTLSNLLDVATIRIDLCHLRWGYYCRPLPGNGAYDSSSLSVNSTTTARYVSVPRHADLAAA